MYTTSPQFGWSRSHMPHKAQPVPPIYQPEVAAKAVVWLSRHYRRELFVGLSTDIAVYGNKVAPNIGDLYLGKTGFASQQTAELETPRRDNLFRPVDDDKDMGAHGTFDHRSTAISTQLWLTMHRDLLAATGLGLGFAALVTRKLLRRSGGQKPAH